MVLSRKFMQHFKQQQLILVFGPQCGGKSLHDIFNFATLPASLPMNSPLDTTINDKNWCLISRLQLLFVLPLTQFQFVPGQNGMDKPSIKVFIYSDYENVQTIQ